jgi:hypothetical protein
MNQQVPRLISDIISEAEKQTDPVTQASVLSKNSCAALKMIIGYAMDPTVKWLLPETDPPFRPLAEATDQEGNLYREVPRMLGYFINTPDGLKVAALKREQLFIQFLESIPEQDARLILRAKNKNLKLSKEAVKIAFPNISKNW